MTAGSRITLTIQLGKLGRKLLTRRNPSFAPALFADNSHTSLPRNFRAIILPQGQYYLFILGKLEVLLLKFCFSLPCKTPILTQNFVDLVKQLADRAYLVAGVHAIDLFNIAKACAVFRDDARQCRVHSPSGDHVVAGDVLDLLQLVFGLKVAHRDDLNGVLFAVGDVDEHRAEVTHTLARADLFAQVVFVFFRQIRVVGVEDVARVCAVAVVAAAEQGRGFVEQQRLQPAEVVRYAVNGLLDVVVHDVGDLVLVKVDELVVCLQHAVTTVDLYPHVDRGQVLKLQAFPERIGVAVEERIPKHHVVQRSTAHGVRTAAR